MKKTISLLLTILLFAMTLTACSEPNVETATVEGSGEVAPDANGEVIKIGGIGPTTGGNAVYGLAVKNGAQLAINEINEAGGANGYQIEFNFQDDEHDAEKAINAYNTLKDWNMQILMGAVTSTPSVAIATETNNDMMFQLTPSASAVKAIEYDNAFSVCFTDPNQGLASANYISDHELATKVAVIYDSSDVYSSGIYEKFITQSAENNIEIVAAEAFTVDSKTDFSVQLQKAKSQGAELVFLPIYHTEAALILSQADSIGFEPTFFGCDGLDGILAMDNFDTELAEDVMLLTPFAADAKDELTVNFVNSYKANYDEVPNQFAANAYDAIYILKAAIEDGNVTPDMTVDAICEVLKTSMTKITIDGLSGLQMTWTTTGEVNKEPKAVQIIDGIYTGM